MAGHKFVLWAPFPFDLTRARLIYFMYRESFGRRSLTHQRSLRRPTINRQAKSYAKCKAVMMMVVVVCKKNPNYISSQAHLVKPE
jgi:hypothetical protein